MRTASAWHPDGLSPTLPKAGGPCPCSIRILKPTQAHSVPVNREGSATTLRILLILAALGELVLAEGNAQLMLVLPILRLERGRLGRRMRREKILFRGHFEQLQIFLREI
jgi:hypothetical protein